MLSVRAMRKATGKRLLRHRMARVLMVEEPLPRQRPERPVSTGKVERDRRQAFSARVVGNLLQLLLEYGDEFKCVPGQNRSIKFSTQQHSVSKHSHHLITHHLRHHHRLHHHLPRLLRIFTLVPLRCEGATTDNFSPTILSPPFLLLFPSSCTPLRLLHPPRHALLLSPRVLSLQRVPFTIA